MLFFQTWDTALAKRNRHSPSLQGKAKGRMRTDNTQWQRPCEESGHSGGKTAVSEDGEDRNTPARSTRRGADAVWRRAKGWHRGAQETPNTCGPPPAELGLLGGKGRTRTAENLEEPQGTRERSYEVGPHGAALLGAPRALGTGVGRSVTGGCGGTGLSRVCGCKPPQAEACEDWGGGGRPPPRLKGSRRGAKRKGPRPGAGGRRRLTPPHGEGAVPALSSRQTAGGRAAEAPTHPPRTRPALSLSPPAGGRITHRRRRSGERRSALLGGAAVGPSTRGRARSGPQPRETATATRLSRDTARPQHRPASRPATTPPPHRPHPPLTQSQGSPPSTIQSQVPPLSYPRAPTSVSQWKGAPPQRLACLLLWRGDGWEGLAGVGVRVFLFLPFLPSLLVGLLGATCRLSLPSQVFTQFLVLTTVVPA